MLSCSPTGTPAGQWHQYQWVGASKTYIYTTTVTCTQQHLLVTDFCTTFDWPLAVWCPMAMI
jgi:hypothetical protein